MNTGQSSSTRKHLRLATGQIHAELHELPMLRPLKSETISSDQYQRALIVFQSIFRSIEDERSRYRKWAEFSLKSECSALLKDLGPGETCDMRITFHCENALLGGLYVAHGAAFGRAVFCQTVRTSLPASLQAFASLPISAERWQSLLTCLERKGRQSKARAEIVGGAKLTFSSVLRMAS